ncbi:hypothetical protein Hanom_Chr03g00229551 [Helianthus anomalus]
MSYLMEKKYIALLSIASVEQDVHISIKRAADVLQTKQNGMIHQDYIILQGLVGGVSSELGYIKMGWVGLLRYIVKLSIFNICKGGLLSFGIGQKDLGYYKHFFNICKSGL